MSFTSWLRTLRSALMPGPVEYRRQQSRRATAHRLGLEVLEDRSLPSTFTVLNLNDSGTDSLRAAVAAANANPGADAIDFATTGTIALTSGQLDITDSLTINGPGAGALTVSGERVSRVFALAGNPTVVIADLTVANGWSGWWSQGGGVYMAGGNLTLARVTVSRNEAHTAGGGLYVAGGSLTLDHSTLSSNTAVGGDGFITNGGQAAPAGGALGGGLYVAGGTVYINQSTFSGNRAVGGKGNPADPWAGALAGDGGEGEGGGLYVGGGGVFIDNSTFSGNWAAGGNGGEGSEDIIWGSTTPSGWGGRAAGGGIRVWDGWGGVVHVNQSTFSGNSATGGLGGGLGTSVEGGSGFGVGGGLSIAPGVPPLANLDTFTEAHTVNNLADIDPNISGPYSLNGTLVPTMAINDVSTLEGNTGTHAVIFTIILYAASTETITVAYATGDGTATAGSDYAAASGTLTFAPGETSKTIPVDVIGDRLSEPQHETFFVNLSSPSNATIADSQGSNIIVDDETYIHISDVTALEGNDGTTAFVFTVTRSGPSGEAVSVDYATADGTATSARDYVAISGTLTIPADETTGTITVQVNGDRIAEPNKTFFVNLGNATNAVIVDGQGVGTVADDEPRISISDVTKAEGKNRKTTLFTFTVTLSAAYDQAVTTSFSTVNGTATTSDNDYIAKTGTLTFAPGETTKTITIEVKGDSKREANETFYLDLFGPSTNALFTKKRGLGTILNDD